MQAKSDTDAIKSSTNKPPGSAYGPDSTAAKVLDDVAGALFGPFKNYELAGFHGMIEMPWKGLNQAIKNATGDQLPELNLVGADILNTVQGKLGTMAGGATDLTALSIGGAALGVSVEHSGYS
jgi:hypothetical protein